MEHIWFLRPEGGFSSWHFILFGFQIDFFGFWHFVLSDFLNVLKTFFGRFQFATP